MSSTPVPAILFAMSVETTSYLNQNASQLPKALSGEIQNSAQRMEEARKAIVVVGFPNLVSPTHTPHIPKSAEIPEIIFTGAGVNETKTESATKPATGTVRQPMGLVKKSKKLKKNRPKSPTDTATENSKVVSESVEKRTDMDQVANDLREWVGNREEKQLQNLEPVQRANNGPGLEALAENAGKISLVEPGLVGSPGSQTDPLTEILPQPLPLAGESVTFHDQQELDSEAIDKIVDKILRKYPPGSTGLIGFASCDENQLTAEACGAVAKKLAERNEGQVLLIDGELKQPRLSQAAQRTTVNGLKNLMMRSSLGINELLLSCEGLPLDFLPAGNINVKYWLKANERLQHLVEQASSAYRFICISLGNAHEKSTKVISSVCDGVYLFVSMKETSRVVAESATHQFFQTGTPVLGCVVSDVAA